MGKDKTPYKAADAEKHECRRDSLVAKGSDDFEKGFDIAVRREIGRRKQDRQDIDTDDDGILSNLGRSSREKEASLASFGKTKAK